MGLRQNGLRSAWTVRLWAADRKLPGPSLHPEWSISEARPQAKVGVSAEKLSSGIAFSWAWRGGTVSQRGGFPRKQQIIVLVLVYPK